MFTAESPKKYEYFQEYFNELYKAKEVDQDAFYEAFEQFSKVIYENIDKINTDEIASALNEVFSVLKATRGSKNHLMNQVILIMNDIFDAF